MTSRCCAQCQTPFTGRKGKRFCSRACQLKARTTPSVLATRTHLFIPDTQVKPGVDTKHLAWIGRYIVDRYEGDPNLVVIHAGDHWDLPSLSSYDRGKGQMEGRRLQEDLAAGNDGMAQLSSPIHASDWTPELILLRGNHENRLLRAIESDAQLEGILSDDMFESPGWEVHPFLEPVTIDGVVYAHYFYNPMSGRPYSSSIELRLKTLGHSFTQGHQQTMLTGMRYVNGTQQVGIVAGACYLHDEDYKGPQGNAHWRGIVVCNNVVDGAHDPMLVSLDYLCRRYEGVSLTDYTRETA